MALNESRAWLIAYDITDPDRLRRIHRFLKQRAVPVQYSVFAPQDTPARIGRLRAELAQMIDKRSDDVRIYPVAMTPELTVLGVRALPEGVLLLKGGPTMGTTSMHLYQNPADT
jgi:CRISPR-associated protein Cas2